MTLGGDFNFVQARLCKFCMYYFYVNSTSNVDRMEELRCNNHCVLQEVG